MNLLPAFVGTPEVNRVFNCDALTLLKAMPSGSVSAIVTSPPYFGLRDYGVEGQIGLEETPAQFIAALVEIFHEAKRVLRHDGTLWVNMGDSYGHGTTAPRKPSQTSKKISTAQHEAQGARHGGDAKNLLGMPWRLAFALQDDGWILRSDIIWHKPNPMPESVTDRPTKSHEYVFLFAKSAKYWYDADAIKEPVKPQSIKRQGRAVSDEHKNHDGAPGQTPHSMFRAPPNKQDELGKRTYTGFNERYENAETPMANKRSVWTVTTESTAFAHFATFPQALITPMILAGCPDKTCVECGAPWVRVTERETPPDSVYTNRNAPTDEMVLSGSRVNGVMRGHGQKLQNWLNEHPRQTVGFEPTCSCGAAVCPGLVLDPFMGSGTTALVARANGRDYIGSELNIEYVNIARERLRMPYEQHYITRDSAPMADLPLFAANATS